MLNSKKAVRLYNIVVKNSKPEVIGVAVLSQEKKSADTTFFRCNDCGCNGDCNCNPKCSRDCVCDDHCGWDCGGDCGMNPG
jgi:hypothetical protein